MKTSEEKISVLEQQVKRQTQLIADLTKRVVFLERENARRKSEVTQLGQRKNER